MDVPPPDDRPFVIGITGNIACGKTAVLKMAGTLGAETIDADALYHELIAPDQPCGAALVAHFGEEIIGQDRGIDRRALGAIVFSDPAALADLDQLTHPAVIAESRRRIAASRAAVVAIDAVKLIESGMDAFCDTVWLVTCRPEQQIERLMARNGFDRAEAERRVRAQPLSNRNARADIVIDNSGSLDETLVQVRRAWAALPLPAPARPGAGPPAATERR